MIIRDRIVRATSRECSRILRNHGIRHVRFASVSPQFLQSRPAGPPRTDYLQKYQDKLERKAKEEGVESISELRERYQPKISTLRKTMDAVPPRLGLRRPTGAAKAQQPPSIPPVSPHTRTLSSYVDVDKLRQHTDPKEIELIWRAGHTKESQICAVIPSEIYSRMVTLAHQHPMFILPLPRETGIEMHFMQFKFPERNVSHLLFTSLLEYKTQGEFARPHTTIMHFEDLKEEKGIVLMRGEVNVQQKTIGLDEASLLVMNVQRLYGAEEGTARGRNRRSLIEAFTKGSEEFNVDKLMDELNRID